MLLARVERAVSSSTGLVQVILPAKHCGRLALDFHKLLCTGCGDGLIHIDLDELLQAMRMFTGSYQHTSCRRGRWYVLLAMTSQCTQQVVGELKRTKYLPRMAILVNCALPFLPPPPPPPRPALPRTGRARACWCGLLAKMASHAHCSRKHCT